MKFLIIDDSKAMRKMVQRMLWKAGYDGHLFEFAENGMEGLERIKSWKPDLVLSDWHMPLMNGLDLLKEIKKQELDVKIGLVTTEHSAESIREAENAGALFLVSKPFTPEQLADAVLNVIKVPDETKEVIESVGAEAEKVHELLDKSFNIPVNVAKFPAANPVNYPYVVGLYVNQAGEPRGLCCIDNALASFLGAAMTKNDSDDAYDTLALSSLGQEYFDSCTEVLSVMVKLFADAESCQDLELRTTHIISGSVSKLEYLFNNPYAARDDYMVEVEGYGAGRLLISSF